MSARTPYRGLGATALLWRQLSTRAGASIGVALLVFGAATIGMAAPRAVERLNTASMQQRVSELTAPERDLVADAAGGPEVGPVPEGSPDDAFGLPAEVAAVWGKQEAALRGIRNDLSPLLQRSLGAPEYTVQFGALRAQKPGAGPAAPVHLVLPTFDPRLAERVRYVDGAAPRSDATPLPRAEAVEIALSEQTAADMEWPLGEERWTELDGAGAQLLRLAGIYVAADAEDPYWQHTLAALASSIVDDGISPPQFTSVAFVDPSSWVAFGAMPVMPRSHIWYPLQLQTLRSTDNAALLVDLREVSTHPAVVDSGPPFDRFAPLDPPGAVPTIPSIGAAELGSSAITTLERSERADAALITVLALTAIGPLGVTVAVIVLGTGIVANRRRRSIGLAAARGASQRQLRFVLALEGALIAVPAALLGAVLGTVLVPGVEPSTVGIVCAVLLAATPLTVLVGRASAFGADGMRSAGSWASSGSAHPARHRLRAVLELATVGLAAAGTVAVLGRGYDEESSGVDPLLAATPLLLSLAVCV
ncbi:MAG: ABC transporter permease, partial [Microterricola sp.]